MGYIISNFCSGFGVMKILLIIRISLIFYNNFLFFITASPGNFSKENRSKFLLNIDNG